MTHKQTLALFSITLALLMTASSVAAGTITLRNAVRLPANAQQVRLADIAVLEGTDAERFADLVIAELNDPTAAVEITVRQVRMHLDDAGVHWGRTSLNGRSVTVRPRRTGETAPPLAMEAVAVKGASTSRATPTPKQPQFQLAADLADQQTLRSMIALHVANGLGVHPHELQLSFDDRHADLLDAVPDHRRFEIEPSSNLRSSRIDLTVRVWIDGLIDHRRSFSVSPLVYTPVVLVNEEIRRDEMIRESALRVEHQWLSPALHGLLKSPSDAAGRHAAARLREGDTLRDSHLRREMLIRRGEQVIVRCVVGSAIITLQAEARADGGKGDTIEFRKLGERETFLAVVTGRNEAMVDLSR